MVGRDCRRNYYVGVHAYTCIVLWAQREEYAMAEWTMAEKNGVTT